MKTLLIFILFGSLDSQGQYSFRKSVCYVKKFNTDAPKNYESSFIHRPDSLFNIVLYNDYASLSFNQMQKPTLSQEKISELSEYSFADLDSGLIIKKKSFCEEKFRFELNKLLTIPTSKDTLISGFAASLIYNTTIVGDTDFLYVTSQLPKTAGIFIDANIKECVIGFVSKTMSIFPCEKLELSNSSIVVQEKFNTKNIKPFSQKFSIDSKVENLNEGHLFPRFELWDDNKQVFINNKSFAKGKSYILILINSLNICQSDNQKFNKIQVQQKEQNDDLLSAVSKLVKERLTTCYVITNDYIITPENKVNQNLVYVPNGMAWKEKLQILESPLILIVRNDRLIKKLTPLDFESSNDFYIGLKKFLNKKKAASDF